MAKIAVLYCEVVLSTKEGIYKEILKSYFENQSFLDSKEKATKYVIQIKNNNSADLQKKFDEKSSLTL